MKKATLALLLMWCSLFVHAQEEVDKTDWIPAAHQNKTYTTQAIKSQPPILDGILDDDAWNLVEWSGDFVQYRPDEGKAPNQPTQFKILYDEKHLYVAYRCFDSEPDKIERRMSRRDGFEGDWVEMNIDSYNDKRTAFSFTISVSGVKGDEYISENGNNWDSSWDPIWYAKTNIDEEGWTAEIKIPLTQLRFGNKEEHVWGIQVMRRLFRDQQRSTWQFISQNEAGWVSNFGQLNGIRGIKAQKQREIMPYVVGQVEAFEKDEENPFATGFDKKLNAGLDGKIGVTSDLTVDFTINPDFGQVEADPSALRLDGYQNFFGERRPFFIENNNIFDFRITEAEAGGPYGNDNLFYSRRIGSSPHHYPDMADGEYVDMPQNTSILGAAKFSGKTKNGTSIGILESITAREWASISDGNGNERNDLVEPLTNYFVSRVRQDFDGGNTIIGGMFTGVNRDIKGTELDYLHRSAYTSGLDFVHRWKDQQWYVSGRTTFSKVNGSTDAIYNTQTSFERLYQRPDADYLEVDDTKTSLMGNGGNLQIGETGGGNFNFQTGVTWRTPGLDLNDVGFMQTADNITHYFWGGYRGIKPVGILNNYRINYNHWLGWNFGGVNTYRALNVNAHAQFKNFWNTGTGMYFEPLTISNTALRGGPSMKMASGKSNWFYIGTSERNKFRGFLNIFNYWGDDDAGRSTNYYVSLNYQPVRWMSVSLSPSFNTRTTALQYVTNIDYNDEVRYVNATIDQRIINFSGRINANITPNLTIQYYGSPFMMRGEYRDFKYITDSKADNFNDRFRNYSNDEISFNAANDVYEIDENVDGAIDYEIGNPDFEFLQFRSNLVIRWEYIPGSELYIVWSQDMTAFNSPTDMPLRQSFFNDSFSTTPYNIFLLKFSYRFIR